MKKLSRKSALLFGAVLAVCAFAAPMASGASWSVVGTTHVLASPDLGFTAPASPALGSSCADSEFHVTITSAAVMEILGGSFRRCTGQFGATNCTVTATPTNFPWTATARTTSDIQIHNVDVDVLFENHPGLGACPVAGLQTRLTGTLTGGQFDPNATGQNRRVTFVHDDGLSSHSAQGTQPAFVTGTLRDTTTTLNVLDGTGGL